jgi:putative ABC transport system permease protein
MWLLARRNLGNRPTRTLLTALAIALGVGMILATRIVGAAIAESSQGARESRLAGADLEIASLSGARVEADLAARLVQVEGVEQAAAVMRDYEGLLAPGDDGGGLLLQVTTRLGTGLALWGVEPQRPLVAYDLAEGAFLSVEAGREVLLPQGWAGQHGLAVGDEIRLVTGARANSYRIAGLLRSEASVAGPPTAWLPLETLQQAFDQPGMADAILVRLESGYDPATARTRLQNLLGDQYLVTGSAGGTEVRSLFTLTRFALPFAGFVTLMAGGFFVLNAFAISLAERRHELGQLRTLGMSRSQVRKQLLLEALLVALLGAGLGLLLGWALAQLVAGIVAELQDSAGGRPPMPADAIPLAVGTGLLVTVAVASGVAWQAGHTSPLAALQLQPAPERTSRRAYRISGLLGLVLLAGGLSAPAWTGSQAARSADPGYGPMLLASLLIGAGTLCLLPAWLRGFLAVAGRLGASGRLRRGARLGRALMGLQLAVGNVRRQGSRAWLTAAVLSISLTFLIALSGIVLYFKAFLLEFDRGLISGAHALVRPFPPDVSFEQAAQLPALGPVPAALAADLAALEDVARVAAYANVSLPGLGVESGLGDHFAFALSLEKVRGNRIFPAAEGDWEQAEQYFAAGPAIMLPELTARRLEKHPGDTLVVDTLQGAVPFTVALVGGGFPIVTPETAQRYFGSHPFIFLIDPREGVDPALLARRVAAIAERHHPLVSEMDIAQISEVIDGLSDPIVGLFVGLTSLSGLVAALGIVVTLFAGILERSRELGTLRALGMSRGQLRDMVLWEAGLLGLSGSLLGALGGLGAGYIFGKLMIDVVVAIAGIRPLDSPPLAWQVALAGVVLGPLTAALAALYPASRAAKASPVEAMRADGGLPVSRS